jgi:hypothetical protein
MILPALMQDVHTLRRLVVRQTTARTRWMFGFQRRGVRRCECEIRLPNPGLLPQTSQTEATGNAPCGVRNLSRPEGAGTGAQAGRPEQTSRRRRA